MKALESLEDVHKRVTTNLALLIRYAQAESLADRGGTDRELEEDAWYAVEAILTDARNGLARMNDELDRLDQSALFATKGER